jgi:hypothetical protein
MLSDDKSPHFSRFCCSLRLAVAGWRNKGARYDHETHSRLLFQFIPSTIKSRVSAKPSEKTSSHRSLDSVEANGLRIAAEVNSEEGSVFVNSREWFEPSVKRNIADKRSIP